MKDQIETMADLTPSDCIGRDASETIRCILLSFSRIKKVTFASYSHLPLVQNRSHPSESEIDIINNALALREERHLPFWDCAMLAISNSEAPVPTLLDTAATHVSMRKSYRVLDRTEIQSGAVEELISKNYSLNAETCVTSKVVMTDGSTLHLAMMDFHCQPTKAGRLAATAVCKRIFPDGALLLESGESFHAYGLKLLSTTQFYKFLGRALLYSPIIDRAYIAHQLIEGRCALRISGATKSIPKTLALI